MADKMKESLTKGDDYGPNADGIWHAGIRVSKWGNRIEVYGESAEDAAQLRDSILSAWQASQSETVPEGCVVVHSTIHPYERSDMDKVVQLLAHAPDATLFDDPQSYYQHWWELLLAAAAPQKKEGK